MVETENGEKFSIRNSKDSKKQVEFEDEYIFKNWPREQNYNKYSGVITSDTTHGATYIQFDSVRVYLFEETNRFQNIFSTGLLSGQMIYCKLDSLCTPTKEPVITNAETGEPIIEDLWGWTGHTLRIDYFEEIDYLKSKPTQRKFKFWVYPFKIRTSGFNYIFLLELTNKNANQQTDLETFIKGSSVTFLTKARSMI